MPTHPGFIGPCALPLPILVDPFARALESFCCGANQNGSHYINGSWHHCQNYEVSDLRVVKEGDTSLDGQGTLSFHTRHRNWPHLSARLQIQ